MIHPEDLQPACMLCQPQLADDHFHRVRLWEDGRWRLSAVLQGPIAGFAHLEPRRHIPYVTDLDGEEALTLGPVLAAATTALRKAASAEKAYVYVFGDHVPHLHFNLAPHRAGDALVGGPGLFAPDAADADASTHELVANLARQQLSGFRLADENERSSALTCCAAPCGSAQAGGSGTVEKATPLAAGVVHRGGLPV